VTQQYIPQPGATQDARAVEEAYAALNANFDELYAGGPGGGGAWGDITGTLSDQTDLQDALDDKEDAGTAAAAVAAHEAGGDVHPS